MGQEGDEQGCICTEALRHRIQCKSWEVHNYLSSLGHNYIVFFFSFCLLKSGLNGKVSFGYTGLEENGI